MNDIFRKSDRRKFSSKFSLPDKPEKEILFTNAHLIDNGSICCWKKDESSYNIGLYNEENFKLSKSLEVPDLGEPLLFLNNILYLSSKDFSIYGFDARNADAPFAMWKPLAETVLIRDIGVEAECLLNLVGESRADEYLAYANIESMSVHWQRKIASFDALIEGSSVYTFNRKGVDAIQLDSGDSLWNLPFSDIRTLDKSFKGLQQKIRVHDNIVIVLARENGVLGIDKQTGRIAWSNLGLKTRYFDISDNGDIYIADRGRVMVINSLTGATITTYELPPVPTLKNDYRKVGSLVLSDTHLWLGFSDSGDYGGELMAVNLITGGIDYLKEFPGLIDKLFIRNNRLYFQVLGFGSLKGGPNFTNYVLEGKGGYLPEKS